MPVYDASINVLKPTKYRASTTCCMPLMYDGLSHTSKFRRLLFHEKTKKVVDTSGGSHFWHVRVAFYSIAVVIVHLFVSFPFTDVVATQIRGLAEDSPRPHPHCGSCLPLTSRDDFFRLSPRRFSANCAYTHAK